MMMMLSCGQLNLAESPLTIASNNGLNGGGDFVKNDGVFQDRRMDADGDGAVTKRHGWTSK